MTSHAASHAVATSAPVAVPAHEAPAPSRKNLPWSFRQNAVVRALICVVSGIVVGVCGTLVHRLGAQYNVPIGLLLAFLILVIATWSARARSGIVGLALHLMFSTSVAGFFANFMGDILLPMGFYSTTLSFFSQYVGWLWLGGLIVIPVIFVFFPERWFDINATKKTKAKDRGKMAHGSKETDDVVNARDADNSVDSEVTGDSNKIDNTKEPAESGQSEALVGAGDSINTIESNDSDNAAAAIGVDGSASADSSESDGDKPVEEV
ncbi:hypothetical protein OZX73_02930 [Bifidobacterium sp. ESL0775]|uniref:hypothetical protein n=1 Tax=Bifidobacterium sp. ESL0775 TaxID=2983230 RepID=UPI0023F916A9|nr:hypothetical protein [Bifidobacterium sp. ESL0775]WEV69836.1 hypothetical protein OZX73_02930 [Bifidobacterium sp. ESL0775]